MADELMVRHDDEMVNLNPHDHTFYQTASNSTAANQHVPTLRGVQHNQQQGYTGVIATALHDCAQASTCTYLGACAC